MDFWAKQQTIKQACSIFQAAGKQDSPGQGVTRFSISELLILFLQMKDAGV